MQSMALVSLSFDFRQTQGLILTRNPYTDSKASLLLRTKKTMIGDNSHGKVGGKRCRQTVHNAVNIKANLDESICLCTTTCHIVRNMWS